MEHLAHLETIFNTFNEMRISIKGIKSFIGYLSATLLGQRVDAFRLSTAEEKIAALKDLAFPKTLGDLEVYLSLTGWLRQYVPYYCQIVEPLQHRKTALLRLSSAAGGPKRKVYTSKTIITPTQTELEAFEQLQSKFTKPTFLTFFDRKRQLYMDIDSSKRYEVDIMIYHVKGDPIQSDFPRNDIQPILFLLKMLNSAEQSYWPTELEVAGLIWALKKLRYMVESAVLPTIVFTDHSATTSIVKQTTLLSSSTDKLNLRLV